MIKNTALLLLLLSLAPGVMGGDMRVADSRLQACIDKAARDNQWQSAEAFVSLVCHNQGIASLEGLEKFINIKKLSFHKNRITQLSIENFPSLEHLNVSRNNLRSMELENLPQLRELYFFGNRITRIHLPQLPALVHLKGNSSRIQVFTYQALPALEKIYLFDNKLETLDINNLPSMKYMDVRQNPMPDKLYEEMDRMKGITILHDGNAEDWR